MIISLTYYKEIFSSIESKNLNNVLGIKVLEFSVPNIDDFLHKFLYSVNYYLISTNKLRQIIRLTRLNFKL